MKFLSKKEICALAEMLVGVSRLFSISGEISLKFFYFSYLLQSLCVYNFYLTDFFDEQLLDTTLFTHRCFSISLAFMMFFNALGTWFWFSVIRTTKLLNRIHVCTYM